MIDAHLRHQCRRRGHVVASVLQTGQRFPQRTGIGNCISLRRRIGRFQFSQVAGNVCIKRCHLPFQLPATDHLALAGDCLKLRTINCDQLATNQALTPAESHEDPARRREGRAILPAKVGDSLEVRRQPLQQPEHFKVAMAFPLQLARGANLVQIAIQVQLQQVRRIVRRSPRTLRLRLGKAQPGHIDPIHPEVDDTDQMILRNQLVQRDREQCPL